MSEKLLSHICPQSGIGKSSEQQRPKTQKQIEEEIERLEAKIDAMGGIDAAEEEYQSREKKKREEKKERRKMEGFIEPTDVFNFTDVPLRKTIPGMTGRELTCVNFDKSSILKEIIQREYSDDPVQLVGELQTSFILFFVGERQEGLNQWRDIASLLCSCENIEPVGLFEHFTGSLYYQLRLFPSDLFYDTILADSFLHSSLLSYLELTSLTPKLRSKRDKLIGLLRNKFNLKLPSGITDS